MSTTELFLRDVIDIKEDVHTSDFKVDLSQGFHEADERVVEYVVTEQLQKAFRNALGIVAKAVPGQYRGLDTWTSARCGSSACINRRTSRTSSVGSNGFPKNASTPIRSPPSTSHRLHALTIAIGKRSVRGSERSRAAVRNPSRRGMTTSSVTTSGLT